MFNLNKKEQFENFLRHRTKRNITIFVTYFKTKFYSTKVEYQFLVLDEINFSFHIIKGHDSIYSEAFYQRQPIFKVSTIRGYELIQNSIVIEKNRGSFGKAIVGGLLFGGVGAIAGALTDNRQTTSRTKSEYSVRILLDSLKTPLIEVKCNEFYDAARLLQALALIEEKYLESKSTDNQNSSKSDSLEVEPETQTKSITSEEDRLNTLLEQKLITPNEHKLLTDKLKSK